MYCAQSGVPRWHRARTLLCIGDQAGRNGAVEERDASAFRLAWKHQVMAKEMREQMELPQRSIDCPQSIARGGWHDDKRIEHRGLLVE